MVIHNSLKLLQNITEIENMIDIIENQARELCPELNTKKFLEIVFSQVLEKRIRSENKLKDA